MTLKEKDTIRAQYLDRIADLFKDEDIGKIASNKVNFPAVFNGEEYWLEITVAIPKEDDGYEKREEYQLKCTRLRHIYEQIATYAEWANEDVSIESLEEQKKTLEKELKEIEQLL